MSEFHFNFIRDNDIPFVKKGGFQNHGVEGRIVRVRTGAIFATHYDNHNSEFILVDVGALRVKFDSSGKIESAD